MEKYLTWKGDRKEFPTGPMYWLNSNGEPGKAGEEGFDMEAVAVGAQGGKERREKVCKISTTFPATATEMNGHAEATKVPLSKDLLTAPTEVDLPSTLHSETTPSKPAEEEPKEEQVAVQAGALIPATRPEPVTFVTATEGIEKIELNEKTPFPNGEAKHQTRAANLLDPALANGVGKEDAHQNHAASDKSDPAVGGGVEEADIAHKEKEMNGIAA